MTKNYLPSTDQSVSFTSIAKGSRTLHDIVGWSINDKDEATPVLFPAVKKGAQILYSRGMCSQCWNLVTGESYPGIDSAIEALK